MLNTELCKGLEDFPSLFSLAVHLVLVLVCYHERCSVGTERGRRVARNAHGAGEAISNTPAPCSSASQGSAIPSSAWNSCFKNTEADFSNTKANGNCESAAPLGIQPTSLLF